MAAAVLGAEAGVAAAAGATVVMLRLAWVVAAGVAVGPVTATGAVEACTGVEETAAGALAASRLAVEHKASAATNRFNAERRMSQSPQMAGLNYST